MEKLSKTITKKHSKKNSNKGTITSKFGTSGRINHNSRPFYESNLYSSAYRENTKDIVENEVPKTVLNKIFCKSSENMEELVNNSIHLLITSPPYNVGKEYDKDYCGGVPFFYNTETNKWICGETDYEELKKWAKGE